MPSVLLAVYHAYFEFSQYLHECGERDLGGIRFAAEHRFAEEDATKRNAVKAAYQPIFAPHLHRVREATPVQFNIGRDDLAANPRALLARARLRASPHDTLERA